MTAETDRIKALEDALRDVLNGENWRAGKKFDPNSGNFDLSVQRATLAASQPAQPVAAKVKPLAWEQLGDRAWRAPSPLFGSFRVECYGGSPWRALWSVPGFCDTFVDGDFATADYAMKAIEARILAALALQPLTVQDAARVPEIAALIEAATAAKPHIRGAIGFTLNAALRAIAEGRA